MPIKGLTTRDAAIPRLTRIGKLRKGKFEGGKPIDLDYFRYVPENGYEAAAQAFYEAYGPEPRQINVILPHRTLEENWVTWQEEWGKSRGLIHRCDGEYCVQWLKDDMTYALDYDQEQKKPCPGGCTPVGRLSLVIQELFVIGFAGYVTFIVSSKNDLASITGSLLDFEQKFSYAPSGLMGLQCVLRRNLDEIGVHFPKKGGGMYKGKSEKWMVHLDLSPEFATRQIEIAQRQALSRPMEAPPAPSIDAEPIRIDETPFEEETEAPPEPLKATDAVSNGDASPDLEDGSPDGPRPYAPEQLRSMIQESIEKIRKRGWTYTSEGKNLDNYRRALVSNLELCFPVNPQQNRHFVSEYLVGKTSSKDMDDAEIRALMGWLKPHKEGDVWVIDDLARREAQAIVKEALKDAGHPELWGEEQEETEETALAAWYASASAAEKRARFGELFAEAKALGIELDSYEGIAPSLEHLVVAKARVESNAY